MKKLIFICGPNGIGKTSICKTLVKKINNSAYVDSDPCRLMNPFILNDDTIPVIQKNISALLINYLKCNTVDIVIFSYGFHGRRKEVFDMVMSDLSPYQFEFIPFLLMCSEDENIRRMKWDNRNNEQIQNALTVSRKAFSNVCYPKIDITKHSIEESANIIIAKAGI